MAKETCETIRIKCDNEQGFYIINLEDKTEEMVEFVEKVLSKKEQEALDKLNAAKAEEGAKQPWQV
jgi:hypothetical protein